MEAPDGDGYYIGYNGSSDFMAISTINNGTPSWELMNLRDGKVGIGTINPATKLDVNGDVTVRGTLYAPGTIVQTIVKTAQDTSSLNNIINFMEANSNYRISIVPKFPNSIFLIEYSFSINAFMAANTIFQMQLCRNINLGGIPVGVGPDDWGSRSRTSYVSRPNNGYDTNDMQNVYMIGMDSGLTAGITYTYGFKYKRESGGSGRCYFNISKASGPDYGFRGVMTMKITEIAQ